MEDEIFELEQEEIEDKEVDVEEDADDDFEFTDTAEEAESEEVKQEPKQETQSQKNGGGEDVERQNLVNQAYEQGKVEALIGVKNSFTGEEMKNAIEVNLFLKQVEMEKQGFNPLELKDYVAFEVKQQENLQKKEQEQQELNIRVSDDLNSFAKANPNIDVKGLLDDERFMNYAEGKLGNVNFEKIYQGFKKLVGGFEKDVKLKAQSIEAKRKASPGSLENKNGNATDDYYTIEQIKAMSLEEVNKNLSKIEKSLERLNKK